MSSFLTFGCLLRLSQDRVLKTLRAARTCFFRSYHYARIRQIPANLQIWRVCVSGKDSHTMSDRGIGAVFGTLTHLCRRWTCVTRKMEGLSFQDGGTSENVQGTGLVDNTVLDARG